MSDSIRQFKKVMSHFPTGVCVVTARCNGDAVGLTVNSFTSVSLDPLMVLICITRNTTAHEVISQAGAYTVSILAEGQESVSTVFAGAPNNQRFSLVQTEASPLGNPVVEGAIAFLDAEIVDSRDAGDHTIFIGRVTALHLMHEDARPLVYHRGGYRRLAPQD